MSKCGRAGRAARQFDRPRWHPHLLEVIVQPGPGRYAPVVAVDWQPADLWPLEPLAPAPKRDRECLTTEAQPQHGHVLRHCAAQSRDLLGDPGRLGGSGRVLRAERCHEREPRGIGRRLLRCAVHDERNLPFVQPLAKPRRGTELAVLENEPGPVLGIMWRRSHLAPDSNVQGMSKARAAIR